MQRAITYANIPRLSRFLSRCVCASDATRRWKTRSGIFIAEDATHVLSIDTDWPLWMRVSIKFIQGQAVDGIAEIRWVIVLRYVADAIHWICVAPAHNAGKRNEIHLNETRLNMRLHRVTSWFSNGIFYLRYNRLEGRNQSEIVMAKIFPARMRKWLLYARNLFRVA